MLLQRAPFGRIPWGNHPAVWPTVDITCYTLIAPKVKLPTGGFAMIKPFPARIQAIEPKPVNETARRPREYRPRLRRSARQRTR
jgi:hypothetical protein